MLCTALFRGVHLCLHPRQHCLWVRFGEGAARPPMPPPDPAHQPPIPHPSPAPAAGRAVALRLLQVA